MLFPKSIWDQGAQIETAKFYTETFYSFASWFVMFFMLQVLAPVDDAVVV